MNLPVSILQFVPYETLSTRYVRIRVIQRKIDSNFHSQNWSLISNLWPWSMWDDLLLAQNQTTLYRSTNPRKIKYLYSPGHCRFSRAAVLSLSFYIKSGTQHTFIHPCQFATFPFRFRTQFSISLILLLCFLFYAKFFFSFPSIFGNCETRFTGEVASNTITEVNRELPVHFGNAINTTDFYAHLNIDRLHVKLFLKWTVFSNTVSANTIADVMRSKATVRLNPLRQTMFRSFFDPNLQEMATE